MIRTLTSVSALLLMVGVAAAQNAPTAPAPPDAPVALTIVDRDENGLVRRPEASPAEAAVAKLDLSPEARRQVETILRERTKALDQFVRDNLKDLVRLHTAVQSGLLTETRRIVAEFQSKSETLRRLGRLPQELAPVLTDTQKRDLQRMVSQYWQERIREGTIAAESRGERLNLQSFMTDEQLYFVGRELKRSYERVFGSAIGDFQSLLANLKPTEAQAKLIREAIGPAMDPEVAARMTPAEKTRVFFDIYARLIPEQRDIVVNTLREGTTVASGRAVNAPVKPATAELPDDKK